MYMLRNRIMSLGIAIPWKRRLKRCALDFPHDGGLEIYGGTVWSLWTTAEKNVRTFKPFLTDLRTALTLEPLHGFTEHEGQTNPLFIILKTACHWRSAYVCYVGVHTVRCHAVCGFYAVVGTVLLPVVPFCACALILSRRESITKWDGQGM